MSRTDSQMPEAATSDAEPPSRSTLAAAERRESRRHNCIGVAEVNLLEGPHICRGRVYNLSLHGCRIYSKAGCSARSGTPIEIVMEVDGIRFRVGGVVRSENPQHGMGVEFVKLSPRCERYVRDLILEMEAIHPDRQRAS